jgi:hypothetical protein
MTASPLAATAYRWERTVCTDLPFAALLTADALVRNVRVCGAGSTGRGIVSAWADTMVDQGSTLALLSEAEYRCLCERRN